MLSGKISENTVRTALILITTYFVLIFGAIILNVYTNPLGIDDSLKSQIPSGEYAGMFAFAQVNAGGVTDQAGIKVGDILVAINGERITNTLQDQFILNKLKPNEIVEYTIIRDSQPISINVKPRKYFHLLFYIFALQGFIFLLIGFLVGYSAPKEKASLLFYSLGMSCSLGFLIYGGVQLYFSGSSFILYNCFFFSLLFLPILIHFFCKLSHRLQVKAQEAFNTLKLFVYFFITNSS